jgi:hypothetical protein
MARRFLSRQRGSSSVEFVVVFGGFIAVIFFVLETTLYLFFTASLEKAAQAGVRAAVVSPPVAAGVATEIPRTTNGVFGRKCSDGVSCVCIDGSNPPCAGKQISCTAGSCLDPGFTRLLNHMRGFNAGIEAEHITITYRDVGLGFAGGPAAPEVVVTISGVPYRTAIVGLLLCIGEGAGCADADAMANLPARSASMTGEDLAL